ncbi:MAG: ABC transporter permease [Oscillospiraceae bacterium]|nr:ABC transporter permease [Oscillospiraceae bacterium]
MKNEIKELFLHRELLKNLTAKDLKLKYKSSVLGFLWSFLNPILQLTVYSIIFTYIFRNNDIKNFTVFLASGLLPWIFFNTSIMSAVSSVNGNSNLVSKVYFPREIIPISTVLFNFTNFIISLGVLFIFLIMFKYISIYLLWLPILLALLILFTIGLSLILSSLNVRYRDIQHLIEVVFLPWMYLTPIIYPRTSAPEKLQNILLFNPMTSIIECIRNVTYYCKNPSFKELILFTIASILVFIIGFKVFKSREKTFAEEI